MRAQNTTGLRGRDRVRGSGSGSQGGRRWLGAPRVLWLAAALPSVRDVEAVGRVAFGWCLRNRGPGAPLVWRCVWDEDRVAGALSCSCHVLVVVMDRSRRET